MTEDHAIFIALPSIDIGNLLNRTASVIEAKMPGVAYHLRTGRHDIALQYLLEQLPTWAKMYPQYRMEYYQLWIALQQIQATCVTPFGYDSTTSRN